MSYNRDNPAKYGGASDAYYDQNNNFSDEPSGGGGRPGPPGGYGGRDNNINEDSSYGRPSGGGGRPGPPGGYGGRDDNIKEDSSYGRPSGGGGRPGPPGGYGGDNDNEYSSAIHHAQQHHDNSGGQGRGDYGNAVSHIRQNQGRLSNEDIDENHMVSAHQSLYGGQGQQGGGRPQGQPHDENSLGAGAAMQALKMFTSGGSSGGGKNEFIGMAMAQAGKLWEQQSSAGNANTDKQSAINKAAEMAYKMYSKGEGGMLGGTGGPSGLLSLAGKFF
ncbi:hypothetical protein V8E54_001221 [Elaphomyces granulatus]